MDNCPICRDLQPVDCPGCGVPITNVKKTWIDRLNASQFGAYVLEVEHEIFRSIGEPWHGYTPDYPDKYGYYPGCNEG